MPTLPVALSPDVLGVDREYVVSEKGVRNMGGGDFEKGIAALDKINFGKS